MKVSLSLVAVAMLASAFASSNVEAQVLARINNKEISLAEFERRYQQNAALVPGNAPPKEEVLKNVINFELALQEARKLKIDQDPELQEQFNILLYQSLVRKRIQPQIDALKVSENEVRQYYQENPLLRTSHVVLLSRPDMNEKELLDLRTRAENILKIVRDAKGKDFEGLARKHSEGPSARTGGDVDWGARHKLLPEYYGAALKLKNIGDISGIVETPYGLHIIQLKGRKPYSEIDSGYKDYIVRSLKESRGQAIFNQYFEGLRSAAKLTVNEDLLKK